MRSIRYGVIVLLALFALLWRTKPDTNGDTAMARAVLEEADALNSALSHNYSAEELDGLSLYQGAMRAMDRARALSGGREPGVAIPHAKSARALLEHVEAAVYRARFDQIETRVIVLQLAIVGSVVEVQRLKDADAALLAASQEALRENWGMATDQLLLAEAIYQALAAGAAE